MVNRVILVGHLGKDPQTFNFDGGGKVTSFSLATSESWRDQSGAKQTRTEWHDVKIFNDALAEIAANHLREGSKIYLEGQIETRKFNDREGKPREVKEIVLRFNSALQMLDSAPTAETPDGTPRQRGARPEPSGRN